jgi:hypothetical protein
MMKYQFLFVSLAFVVILAGADTAHGQTFTPEFAVTIVDPEPEANSDFAIDFSLPQGDVNFAGVVSFIPKDWGVVPGDQIPIGTVTGEVMAQGTLSIINSACKLTLPIDFIMLNASTDPTDTVIYLDSDDNDMEDYAEDKDGSGLADGIERYPDFITRVVVDDNGEPLKPLRRAAGITIVAGTNILLQFLIFEPGTSISENIASEEELGYPTVTLLQNAGDPAFGAVVGPVTDFCTPLTGTNTTFGVSKDNGCTDAVPANALDPICEATSSIIAEEGGTHPDESGLILFANPQDGTYTLTISAVGKRDADGDGIENGLDTCPFDLNQGDPRIEGSGDLDGDGMDTACDPNDNETHSDQDLDGRLNRGDNCPLSPNDDQRDTDNDQIGDACDPHLDDADAQGELARTEVTQDVIIGTGEGPGGPPSPEALVSVIADDSDEDGIADGVDNCPASPNPSQENDVHPRTPEGDECEDPDGDDVFDVDDNCPDMPNADQADRDGDGVGDVCDPDVDGDEVPDADDNCPDTPNPGQENDIHPDTLDGDHCADPDADDVFDIDDNCPDTPNLDQADSDGDDIGDVCEPGGGIPIGAIVGGVVGGVLLVAAGAGVGYWYLRVRPRRGLPPTG